MQDLWSCDPWDLLRKCRPAVLAPVDQPPNSRFSLQARVLTQLVLCVEEAAGAEAVQKLHVLINLNNDQQEEVTCGPNC